MTQNAMIITGAFAIMMIVGMVCLIDGTSTGESFAIQSFTAPQSRYGYGQWAGFDYGPYQQPYTRKYFFKAQDICDPQKDPKLSNPLYQQECCTQMCGDVCQINYDPTPGTCFNSCSRGCRERGLWPQSSP